MYKMKKLFSFVFVIGIFTVLFAAEIQFDKDPEDFLIFNRRNSKIYNYFLLEPNESVSCKLINIDTLEVYSRAIIKDTEAVEYNMLFDLNEVERKELLINLISEKWDDKKYYRHTGYMGGIKEQTAKEVREKTPEDLIVMAVKGMLPKNKLGRAQLKKLKVYAGADHPHAAQQPELLDI